MFNSRTATGGGFDNDENDEQDHDGIAYMLRQTTANAASGSNSSSNNNGDDDGEEISLVDHKSDSHNEPSESTTLIAQQQQHQAMEGDEEEEADLEDFSNMILAILKPVTITMFFVVWAVRSLNASNNSYLGAAGSIGVIIYSGDEGGSSPSTGTLIWQSLLNGLVFLVIILLTTVCFVLLYKYRCFKAIYTWLFLSVGILLGATGGYIFLAMLEANNLPLDWITFVYVMFNFSVGGIISIFWYAPTLLNQAYLVVISALMAISFTRMPEWTTWTILAVISIYDLFAVLCPKGPLRVLVETAQERNETIPALIYNANFEPPSRSFDQQAPQQQQQQQQQPSQQQPPQRVDSFDVEEQQPQQPQQQEGGEQQARQDSDQVVVEEIGEQKRSLKLGLGDFVFYSVLMGRAALFDISTVFTCFVAIVTGLFATLILLAIFKKALPALPISITFGIIFYFLTRIFLYPYIETLGQVEVFI